MSSSAAAMGGNRRPTCRSARMTEERDPISMAVTRRGDNVRSTQAERPSPLSASLKSHRFRVGQQLHMRTGGNNLARQAGSCTVTFLLPFEGGQVLYRVRSEAESFERVVPEADLSAL